MRVALLVLSFFCATSTFAQTSITGKVVDEAGNKISNANIEIYYKTDITPESVTITSDNEGFFSRELNSSSSIRIAVSHPDFVSRVFSYPQLPTEELNLELTSAYIESAIEFIFEDYDTEAPITDALIACESRSVKLELLESSTIAANGRARFGVIINSNEVGEFVDCSFSHREYGDYVFTKEIKFVELSSSISQFNFQIGKAQKIQISGLIRSDIKEAIEFATVEILPPIEALNYPKAIGTVTNEKGEFSINASVMVPYQIKISHISYSTRFIESDSEVESNLVIGLRDKVVEGEDIIVTASSIDEQVLEEPRTFDKISSVDIQQVAAFNTFELVASLREVDVATQSMNLQSISTRGFNATANPRFLQLTDGVDNTAPGLGFSVGDLLGPVSLDISSIELLVGSNASRYGSNALNGVLLTNSKSAFSEQGLQLIVKSGVHDLDLGGSEAWSTAGEPMYEGTFRYAKAINPKHAFKLSGSYLAGTDWKANNYENMSKGFESLSSRSTPSYSGVNVYGDENYELLHGPIYRTGYKEADIVDYDISTIKLSSGYEWNGDQIQTSIDARYGLTNTLFTSESRIRLEDYSMFQVKAAIQTPKFKTLLYKTFQWSGDSYNVNYLAEQLIISAKSNSDWYRDYKIAYENGLPVYGVRKYDYKGARKFADSGVTLLQSSNAVPRFEPGTEAFQNKVNELRSKKGYSEGASIVDNSSVTNLNVESDSLIKNLKIGINYKFIELDSDGTIFPDTTGNSITNYEIGGYFELKNKWFDDALTTLLGLRVDYNEQFPVNSSQSIGASYALSDRLYIRSSVLYGIRYPTVREQFIDTNIGKGRLVGGLPVVYDSHELIGNSFLADAVTEYQDVVSISDDPEGAQVRNLDILRDAIFTENDLDKIKPERVLGFELGAKIKFSEYIFFDFNYFYSIYSDFIGIKRLVKPRTSYQVDFLAAAKQSTNVSQSDRFFVYSNAESSVQAMGVAFDLRYSSGRFFTGVNGTWSALVKESDDPINPGYNTPPFKFNFDWGNTELVPNMGFKMTYKYRSAHDWKSPFLDGRIETFSQLDIQFNFKLPSINSRLKTGVTNFGVDDYYNVYGGPAIGSILYTSLTYTPNY